MESAKSYGDTYGDKLNLEFNARNQVTLWGPKGQISDYANKNWAGLMKGLLLVISFYLMLFTYNVRMLLCYFSLNVILRYLSYMLGFKVFRVQLISQAEEFLYFLTSNTYVLRFMAFAVHL